MPDTLWETGFYYNEQRKDLVPGVSGPILTSYQSGDLECVLIESGRDLQESQRAVTLGGIALSIHLRGLGCRKSQGEEKPGGLEGSSSQEPSPDPFPAQSLTHAFPALFPA